jgi:glutamate 5-kinase
VEGLFTADPHKDPNADFIDRVLQITPEIEGMAGRSASAVGSGGMTTKIMAAKISVAAGCHMCIAAGHHKHPVRRIEEGARCTWFVPSATPVTARKQWIAGTLRPAGAIAIDHGAMRALFDRWAGSTVEILSAFLRRMAPRSRVALSRTRTAMPHASWGESPRK